MKNLILYFMLLVVSTFAFEYDDLTEAPLAEESSTQTLDYSMAGSVDQEPEKKGYWNNYRTPVRFFSQIGYMDIGMGLKVKMSSDNYFYMMQSLVVLHNWFDGVDYIRVPTEFCVGERHFHGVLGAVINLGNDGYMDMYDLDVFELAFGLKYDFNAHVGLSSRLYVPISRSYLFLLTDFVFAF